MNLVIFSICFNAMPFIERQLPIFEQLKTPWKWIVVHGPSQNGGSTKWCQPQPPGLSTDGTTEYLHSIRDRYRQSGSDRVTLIEKKSWPSKDAMCNAALSAIENRSREPRRSESEGGSVLLQIDSDELWRPDQLGKIVELFESRPNLTSIQFPCRYFVGPNLVLRGENCYGDHSYEWLRAWRYTAGQRFLSHEPPILSSNLQSEICNLQLPKSEARSLGLLFDHHAYATEEQCAYKERFYNYPGLVHQWHALQQHFSLRSPQSGIRNPPSLSRFFPHVKGHLPEVIKISWK